MWFKSECSKVSERLWEYSAQKLPAAETAQIEGHLQQCSRCQAEAEAYRQTVGLLGAARSLPVPASQSRWQDLRPRLAPARRSADLLPRLTLAGAGTALAATLLVVFYGGRPSGSPYNPSPHAAGSPQAAPTQRENSPPVETADNKRVSSGQESMAFGPMLGSLAAGLFAQGPSSASTENPKPVVAPRLSMPRRRDSFPVARLTTRKGRVKSGSMAPDETAQLDGGDASPRLQQQNYVLSPVSSSADEETVHHYVMGSIPVAQSGAGSVAANEGSEEGRAW